MSVRKDSGGWVVSLKQAWAGLLVFYVVALGLNAVSLHQNNERMPYGGVRTFWMAVSGPVAKASEAAGLERFRGWVAERWGEELNR